MPCFHASHEYTLSFTHFSVDFDRVWFASSRPYGSGSFGAGSKCAIEITRWIFWPGGSSSSRIELQTWDPTPLWQKCKNGFFVAENSAASSEEYTPWYAPLEDVNIIQCSSVGSAKKTNSRTQFPARHLLRLEEPLESHTHPTGARNKDTTRGPGNYFPYKKTG